MHDSVQYPLPLGPTKQLHAAVDVLEQAVPGGLVRWIGERVQRPMSAWHEYPAPSGAQSASLRQWPSQRPYPTTTPVVWLRAKTVAPHAAFVGHPVAGEPSTPNEHLGKHWPIPDCGGLGCATHSPGDVGSSGPSQKCGSMPFGSEAGAGSQLPPGAIPPLTTGGTMHTGGENSDASSEPKVKTKPLLHRLTPGPCELRQSASVMQGTPVVPSKPGPPGMRPASFAVHRPRGSVLRQVRRRPAGLNRRWTSTQGRRQALSPRRCRSAPPLSRRDTDTQSADRVRRRARPAVGRPRRRRWCPSSRWAPLRCSPKRRSSRRGRSPQRRQSPAPRPKAWLSLPFLD